MKVLLAGDSTVAACPAVETPMSGWGAHLGSALGACLSYRAEGPVEVVPVVNVARGGATTASFRAEGLWAALLHETEPGDVVVLQFGHNDQKQPELAARQGFSTNLARFVGEAQAAGARAVLCTSVARRRFEAGELVPTHGDHVPVVIDLAAELGVPCLDLHRATSALLWAYGEEGSRDLFTQFAPAVHPLWPAGIVDDTHFSTTGAIAVADLVAAALVPVLTRTRGAVER